MRRKKELQQRMDIDDSDIVIQGNTTTRISRKQVYNILYLQNFNNIYIIKTFIIYIYRKNIFFFLFFVNFTIYFLYNKLKTIRVKANKYSAGMYNVGQRIIYVDDWIGQ